MCSCFKPKRFLIWLRLNVATPGALVLALLFFVIYHLDKLTMYSSLPTNISEAFIVGVSVSFIFYYVLEYVPKRKEAYYASKLMLKSYDHLRHSLVLVFMRYGKKIDASQRKEISQSYIKAREYFEDRDNFYSIVNQLDVQDLKRLSALLVLFQEELVNFTFHSFVARDDELSQSLSNFISSIRDIRIELDIYGLNNEYSVDKDIIGFVYRLIAGFSDATGPYQRDEFKSCLDKYLL
jgi:hypothetical protein